MPAPTNKPAQSGAAKTKSSLASKLGPKADEAVRAHANDDTRYGFINLPPGIDNGVAVLTQAYFGEYETGDNKGKVFFRAVGNVLEPYEARSLTGGKMRTAGLTTSVMIPLCDTKKSNGELVPQEKYIDDVMNVLRQLGGKDYTVGATVEDLEPLAEGLLNPGVPIYFKFTTSPRVAQKDGQGVKKGDVTGAWENWHGAIDDYVPEESAGGVNDGSGQVPTPSANGNGKPVGKHLPVTPDVTDAQAKAAMVKRTAPPPPVEEAPPFVPETCDDLDLLLADAESTSDTNADSQERIKAIGIEAGVDETAQSKLDSWADVVAAINEARDNPPQDEEGVKVGDRVGFHPKDPTTKKKSKNAVTCTVTAVNGDKVDMKAGKATYKNIPLTDLVDAPDE